MNIDALPATGPSSASPLLAASPEGGTTPFTAVRIRNEPMPESRQSNQMPTGWSMRGRAVVALSLVSLAGITYFKMGGGLAGFGGVRHREIPPEIPPPYVDAAGAQEHTSCWSCWERWDSVLRKMWG